MPNKSAARARWEGDLKSGAGTVQLGSGLGGELPLDWKTRTEGGETKTTPEELIAGAHASCFSMAFSNILAGDGYTPESLDTDAVVTFDQTENGFAITAIELRVHGAVPGISAEDFALAAEKAKDGCPVSQALSDDIRVTVNARLA